MRMFSYDNHVLDDSFNKPRCHFSVVPPSPWIAFVTVQPEHLLLNRTLVTTDLLLFLQQATVVTPQCLCTHCPLVSNATVPVCTANHTISPKWHVSVTHTRTQQVAVTTASGVQLHILAVRSGRESCCSLGALGMTVSRLRPVWELNASISHSLFLPSGAPESALLLNFFFSTVHLLPHSTLSYFLTVVCCYYKFLTYCVYCMLSYPPSLYYMFCKGKDLRCEEHLTQTCTQEQNGWTLTQNLQIITIRSFKCLAPCHRPWIRCYYNAPHLTDEKTEASQHLSPPSW